MPAWDPQQYRRYDAERSRPFFDLMSQVHCEPAEIVDLGCGPGNLTASLAERWPGAHVLGVDSSPAMIEAARTHAIDGRLEFVVGDLLDWEPDGEIGLIVSNATLHWVPGHRGLLGRFASYLRPGGALAFQVPGNFRQPSHVLLHELRTSPEWSGRLGEGADRSASADEPAEYLEALLAAGLEPNVWETTYLQLLTGDDPVLEWMKGTALRPVLSELDEVEAARFCDELARHLRVAYPPTGHGTVLPFRRIFAVGHTTTS